MTRKSLRWTTLSTTVWWRSSHRASVRDRSGAPERHRWRSSPEPTWALRAPSNGHQKDGCRARRWWEEERDLGEKRGDRASKPCSMTITVRPGSGG